MYNQQPNHLQLEMIVEEEDDEFDAYPHTIGPMPDIIPIEARETQITTLCPDLCNKEHSCGFYVPIVSCLFAAIMICVTILLLLILKVKENL